MRLLLDMGLAQSTAVFLRAQGHDAVHLRDEGLQRLSDHDIVGKAEREERIILTHDLDFGRIVALSQAIWPSVITFRLKNMRSAEVNRHLAEVLMRFAEELNDGALITVTDQSIRVRQLPATGKPGDLSP